MFGRRPPSSPPAEPGDPYARAREEMIEYQLRRRGVVMRPVIDALRAVPRHLFVSHPYSDRAYADEALPTIEGQSISQPFMVGIMTQELNIHPGQRILELGTGTGYQTAVLAWLLTRGEAPPGGAVYTIERIPTLAEFAERRLAAMQIHNVQFFVGDGSLGWPTDDPAWEGPRSEEDEPLFDRILVTAGAPRVPHPLTRQLKTGGILIVPVGPGRSQTLMKIEKHSDRLVESELLACHFVPLLGANAWDPVSYERLKAEQSDTGEQE